MKYTSRSACIALACTALFSITVTATNLKEATKQWTRPIRNTVLQNQAPTVTQRVGLQRNAVSKHRLDSMVVQGIEVDSGTSVNNQKNTYHYNSYGQIIRSETFDHKDENGNWVIDEKTVSTYDSFGYKLADTTYSRDLETNQLYSNDIREYRYSSKGLLLMESCITRFFVEDSWRGEYKEEYQFNENDLLVRQLSYSLKDNGVVIIPLPNNLNDSDTWVLIRKRECAYDASGTLITETQYYRDIIEEMWVGYERKVHAYDALLRDTSIYSYNGYSPEDLWSLSNRERIHYDTQGNIIRRNQDRWIEDSKRWIEEDKKEYAYDQRGNKLQYTRFGMDTNTKEWALNYREDWTYDEKGNTLTDTYLSDIMENRLSWIEMRSTYVYDHSIPSDKVVWPFKFEEFDMNVFNMLTGGKLSIYYAETDSVIDLATIAIYYSPMEVLGNQSTKGVIAPWLYNTSTKSLSFDSSIVPTSVQLYDTQGRQVFYSQGMSSTTLSLNDLKKGLYLMRLIVDGKVQRGKLMVE